jgi:hypothetical protein
MFLDEKLIEEEEGIYTRKATKNADSEDVEAHYRENALKILKDDRKHYTNLSRRFAALLETEFYSVADIGGGHPKLASIMNVSEVTVYDQFPDIYEETHDEFLKLYPTKANIKYEKKKITHSQFSPNAEVAICSHVLEHLTIEQIRRLFANIEVNKLLVYGPNVEKARNENWLHYKPGDHITFATIEGMSKMIEEAGFNVKLATPHNEDYMLFAEK